MGLLSFVKEAGEKIWDAVSGKDADTQAEKLKNHLNELGLTGADNLEIEVSKDGIVTISGDIYTQDVKEKILVAAGNVSGVVSVNDSIRLSQNASESRYYTVKSGDTLSAISRAMYGTADEYPRIFEANKPMLMHPDKIYPGQVLIIPGK
ncbi:peptidoglycan-binding protein LysM [Enterobacter hormaechei]|uniref:peptidoglycan-binding protein LysM n=1 Tax=Enterobacter hormaechei TaxID=158836 RepID=UPI0032D9CEFC